jgi:ribonucleoside-diphosphate reductase beta chain
VILGFNAKLGLFKDMSNVVQYSSKEETLHSYAGMALLNQVRKEFPDLMDEEFDSRIYEEAQVAYEAECNLIDWVLENGYSNAFITPEKLKNYVAFRLNDGLSKIGLNKIIPENQELTEQTFWMEEEIMAPAMTDFFSKDPIEYQKNNKTYKEEDLF